MNKDDSTINKFYIKNYGCQMNVSDSEIVSSILLKNGYSLSENIKDAKIIFFNSCSIRKKSELTIINQLNKFEHLKKNGSLFGMIGCFSKEFKEYLLNKNKIDFFINPNSYKKIPNIISYRSYKKKNTDFFFDKKKESYDNIYPYKNLYEKKVTTFLSITRGCNNMCTFCIVPFTRGREISNNPDFIIKECTRLYTLGYKEITLLGQNVDSYKWKQKNNFVLNFSHLLEKLAKNIPDIRIRFTTSNPHDMSDDVIEIISKYENICNHIHLPVQSGSNKILKLMNRKYSKEDYLLLINKIRKIIPNCSISHDIMVGFCNEEEKDHLDTIDLMNKIKYNYGYMFSYSPRPGTYAYNKLVNNVPDHIKKRRLQEIINLQNKHSLYRMNKFLNKKQKVLIEGSSKKNNKHWYGRNQQNLVVVFPKNLYTKIGDLVSVKVKRVTSATLIGYMI
ncbi:tRNA (N6-isopentenyl adenosine(37)-C2)-methylthiotransferase MiaB [Blattabacterium cuenoti]|uniref:tRNA (N6-isopentenyl adenosine(37)-C2)-methylthiotransferase MiaB n=1 Tax=Blattabacterium cuenoti TaxID=1653831 RepID=UPI00163B6F16|nr:tRNA (N6-isopentenyl adenosine(37)-C2)-methylthiotransferase MiaB [Blattabacterium cuenoti]